MITVDRINLLTSKNDFANLLYLFLLLLLPYKEMLSYILLYRKVCRLLDELGCTFCLYGDGNM